MGRGAIHREGAGRGLLLQKRVGNVLAVLRGGGGATKSVGIVLTQNTSVLALLTRVGAETFYPFEGGARKLLPRFSHFIAPPSPNN